MKSYKTEQDFLEAIKSAFGDSLIRVSFVDEDIKDVEKDK